MKRETYVLKIREVIENSDRKLSLKEIVTQTGVPKATAHRIIKSLDYKCVREPAWNKGLSKENNASMLASSLKQKNRRKGSMSEETKRKLSEKIKGRSRIPVVCGRGNIYDYGDDVVCSDYELKIAQLLDEEGIVWDNVNNVFEYIDDDGVTRFISLGFYLPDYDLYMPVKYHITNDVRKRIRLTVKQNHIKVIVVDEMMFRRITYNNIKDIIKNCLQND